MSTLSSPPRLLDYRFLFEQMVLRELRQRYKGSTLGILWYLVNPLLLMGAYTLMFRLILKAFPRISDYALFLIIGITVWTFFSQALLSAASSLIDQSSLVRQVRFPREAIPAAVVTVQLLTFLALFALLAPVAVAIRGTLEPSLLLLPLILVCLFAFAMGLALVVSALHAHYRDVAPILSALLLPWFFVTPIFFRVTDVAGLSRHPWLESVLRWGNPVAPFIDAVRSVLYDGRAPGASTLAYVAVVGAVSLVAGRAVFHKLEPELAVLL
jgi:ABC-type polysaccharide/polyol phosphate export permease